MIRPFPLFFEWTNSLAILFHSEIYRKKFYFEKRIVLPTSFYEIKKQEMYYVRYNYYKSNCMNKNTQVLSKREKINF